MFVVAVAMQFTLLIVTVPLTRTPLLFLVPQMTKCGWISVVC